MLAVTVTASACAPRGLRVAAIGDSITWGRGVDRDSDNYTAQLCRLLDCSRYDNIGIPGADSRLIAVAIPAIPRSSNLIVVEAGTNDVISVVVYPDQLSRREDDYRRLVGLVRLWAPHATLILVNVRNIARAGYPSTKDRLTAATRRWNAFVRRFASENDLKLLDVECGPWYDTGQYPDLVHPSSAGAANLARHIAQLYRGTDRVDSATEPCDFKPG